MEAVDQDGAPSEPTVADPNEHRLQLQLHTDEAVWMRQIGHLKDWCSKTTSIQLGVPARVPTPLAASSLRLLWLFQNLRDLDINFNSTRARIEQPVVLACAELLNLTSLQLLGGHLCRRGLDLGVLTSLRRLRALAVRPHSDEELDGLEDEHLAGAARLTGLVSLSLRASENVTDEGVTALTALTGLTQLSLLPMGLYVTREGVSALSAALRQLEALSVGLHECRQVAAIKGFEERPRPAARPSPTAAAADKADAGEAEAGEAGGAERGPAAAGPAPSGPLSASLPAISLVVNSPEVSTSGFFSTLTLVLRPRLVSLRMATVEAGDPSFMLALGTLVHLTELKMGVSLPEGGQPFTCNLAALSSLARLHTLEFAVTQDLQMPLSVKMVSLLSLSWPRLRSLSLSAMAKPEVMPEALDLLDNFRHLTSLSLFAPLDYSSDDDPSPLTLPVNPRYLPRGLQQLVLECAHLRDLPHRTSAASSQEHPQQEQQQQQPGPSSQGQSSGEAAARAQPTQAEDAAVQGSGGASTRGSVLPRLEHLELNSCQASDAHLAALLCGATGLRHLELTDVGGITDAALSALRSLTRLEHLVVRLSGTGGGAAAAAGAPAAPGSSASAASAGVTHRSLGALCNASMLRHLEWSLSQPLGAPGAREALSGVLSTLDGLQELYLDVVPELRAGTGPGGSRAAGEQRGGPAAGEREGGSGASAAADPGVKWRERLQRALPLCTVAERPGIVIYDLWNDRTVQVVGL